MFELIRANQRRTAFLVVAMAALLLAVGWAVGALVDPEAGLFGLGCGFLLWVVLTLVAYYQGDAVFLSLAGARRIEKADHPVLFNVVEEMALAAGLPRPPAVYVMDVDAPNAFATGRDPQRASVAVTAGLLERLDRDELQGVIAHELGHVRNRDVLYLMMLGVMFGSIVILADIGRRVLFFGGGRRRTSSRDGGGGAIVLVAALVLMLIAPFVAQLLYFAVSRRREYLADASSAQFTRFPEGLARALEKISAPGPGARLVATADAQRPQEAFQRTMTPMFIVEPPAVQGSRLYSTHPPVEERIRILRGMAGDASLARYQQSYQAVTRRAVGVIPFGALQQEKAPPAARGAQPDATTRLDRVRAATDMLWRLNQFVFVACPCGTKLKFPPVYIGQRLACPHCGREHLVQPAGPVS